MKFGVVITVSIPVYLYRLAHYSVMIKTIVGKVIISAAYLRIAFSLGMVSNILAVCRGKECHQGVPHTAHNSWHLSPRMLSFTLLCCPPQEQARLDLCLLVYFSI